MIVARREIWTARTLLVLLMAITLLPFVSLFTTALHASGTYPLGLDWPSDPHWGNFADAFRAAHMGELLKSSVLIVLGVVPASLLIATMAGFAIGHLRMAGSRVLFLVFVLGVLLDGLAVGGVESSRRCTTRCATWACSTRGGRSSCRSSGCSCRSRSSGCARTS